MSTESHAALQVRIDTDPDFVLSDHLAPARDSPTGVTELSRSAGGHHLTFTPLVGPLTAAVVIDHLSSADLIQVRTLIDAHLNR